MKENKLIINAIFFIVVTSVRNLKCVGKLSFIYLAYHEFNKNLIVLITIRFFFLVFKFVRAKAQTAKPLYVLLCGVVVSCLAFGTWLVCL